MEKRHVYLDILRVMAIVSVVLMHSSSMVQQFFNSSYKSFEFQFTNIFDTITRIAVPLFVMISGRLMINKGLEYRQIVKKCLHFICLFMIWSFVYSIILVETKYVGIYSSIGLIVNTIIDTLKGYFHFWYLFLICGLYLIIPFIELLINNMSKEEKKIFILLNVIFCFIIPTILLNGTINNILGEHLRQLNVGMMGGYVLYFMLGHWLAEYKVKNRKTLYFIFGLSLIYTVIVTNIPAAIFGHEITGLRENLTPNILIATVSLFLIVKDIFDEKKISCRTKGVITKLSELSFGVYLVHMLVMELIAPICINKNCVISLIALFAFDLTISYFISWILWNIRITHNLVR